MTTATKLTDIPKAPQRQAMGGQGEESIRERVECLKKVRLFSELKSNIEAMAHLASKTDVRHFHKGQHIIVEGEEGTDAFFLITGEVKVTKTIAGGESFPVAHLTGDHHPFFGEAALLEADQRSASIITASEAVCLVLTKQTFDDFCKHHPEWALPVVLRIAKVVLERLHKTNHDVILLYNALVDEVKG